MASTRDLSNLDEKALRILLDVAPDYDERCRIRSAIRALKKPGAATTTSTTTANGAPSATSVFSSRNRNANIHRSATFTSSLPSVQISGATKLPHQSHLQTRSNSFTVKNNNHSNANQSNHGNGNSLAQRRWGKHLGGDVANGNTAPSSKFESRDFSTRNGTPGGFTSTWSSRQGNTKSSQPEASKRSYDNSKEARITDSYEGTKKTALEKNYEGKDEFELKNLLKRSTALEARASIRAALQKLRDNEENKTSFVIDHDPVIEDDASSEPQVVYYSTHDSDVRLTSDSDMVTLKGDTITVTVTDSEEPTKAEVLDFLRSKLKSVDDKLHASKDFDYRRKLRGEMRELRAQVREVEDGQISPSLSAAVKDSKNSSTLPVTSLEITAQVDGFGTETGKKKEGRSNSSSSSSTPEATESDSEPKFIEPLLDLVAVDGEPATLECQILAQSGGVIKWYKDDKLIPPSKDFEQTFDGKTAKFIIGEVYPDDGGCYTCAVETSGVRIETSAKVTVQDNENLVAPDFLQVLTDVNVTEGDEIALHCMVCGSPPPSITWYMGRKVLPCNEIYAQTFDGKTARLGIEEAELGDQGMYKCIIQNKAGEAKCSCRIRVSAKDHRAISEEDEDGCIGPDIVKCLESKFVTEGQQVTFTCEVKGHPPPSVTWYKDDVALARGLRLSQSYEGKVATLKIKDVRKSDGGEYSCTARNERGDAGTSANLTIRAKTAVSSPQRPPLSYQSNSPSSAGRKMGALEALAANLKTKIKKQPPRVLDPDADPYEGLDLSSSEEDKDKMADIDKIDDEELLHKMMNKTDNFEERKRIRGRLRELREAEAAKFAAAKEARDATRESAVELRQRQAAKEKERKMRDFQEQAKEGKKDSGIMEQELRRKHAEAAAAKEAELEKMKELGKAMSAAHHAGHEIKTKAEQKARTILGGKDANEDSVTRTTKTERGADGRLTTTTSTTTSRTKDGEATVLKQNKQITQTSGIGGTTYSIKKASASDTADRLAQTFSNKAFPGSTGMIKVKTESWNSKDGATKRAEKTKSWGASGAGGARAAFQKMDAANPGGGRSAGQQFGGGGGGGSKVAIQRSPSAIKQMLLDWCKRQTEGYEHVDITNFSSSWNNGMAFCALIHRFYPHAFTYSKLDPRRRKANFQLGFDVAEKYADIAPLLDVEDMVRMKNPDWKCVFCYIQSFYRKFRDYDPTKEENKA